MVWLVAFVSAALLGFQIALMRILLIAGYHHFAFLVISISLVGFGAAGTCLCLARVALLSRRRDALLWLALGTAVAMPLCADLAQHLPVEARYVPALGWTQAFTWLLLWSLLTIPFLLGASAIGLALMAAGDRVALVYGSNLLGSGVGALAAALLMSAVMPQWLAAVMAVWAFVGAASLFTARPARVMAVVGSVGIVVLWLCFESPHIRPDPFKDLANMRRLQRQGTARRLAVAASARGLVELYRSDAVHSVPFLGPGVAPPKMDLLLIDGHGAGAAPRIATPQQAAFVDQTLMAFAYDLAPDQPHVLLLGERGGTNVWLALRRRAAQVDAVWADPNVTAILRRHDSGAVWRQHGVRPIAAEPRHYVETSRRNYDLIQLVGMEALPAGSGGAGGLAQNHLVTVQGIAACLRRLGPRGVLFACRGMQTPPRDNIKLLATFVAALRRLGHAEPRRHMVIVRDYLAVCTIVRTVPWDETDIARCRRACEQRQLTPVWFESIRDDELNVPDMLPGPDGEVGDWYHTGAVHLFSSSAPAFIDGWSFDIRPPTDDRPFFNNFFRWRALRTLSESFGELWPTQTGLAFLFVCGALAVIGVVAALCTLVPVVLLTPVRSARGKAAVGFYFLAIGLAYMMLEMTLLSRVRMLIGDPVQTAAVTIAGLLVFSGFGSLAAQYGQVRLATTLPRWIGILAAVAVLESWCLGPLGLAFGMQPLTLRVAVALAVLAPLGFLMGLAMPTALARLNRVAPVLIPWAWAVNGFASVLAAPLATAMGMAWGYSSAAAAAVGLYLIAAILFRAGKDLESDQ